MVWQDISFEVLGKEKEERGREPESGSEVGGNRARLWAPEKVEVRENLQRAPGWRRRSILQGELLIAGSWWNGSESQEHSCIRNTKANLGQILHHRHHTSSKTLSSRGFKGPENLSHWIINWWRIAPFVHILNM